MMGTIAGLANWLSIALKATFAAIGIGAMASAFIPDSGQWTIKIIAIIFCLIFTAANLISVKTSGTFQNILVVALLAILVAYVSKGIFHENFNILNFENFTAKGTHSIFAVAGMVFISFGGLSKVVSVSEEIKNSKRNLLLGMFLSLIVVNIFYLAVVFVTIGIVDGNSLSGSLAPIELGGELILGQAGKVIIAIAAFLAFATTINSGLLSASRTPLAMSKDGLLPKIFSHTNKKFHTPDISLLLTFFFMFLLISFLGIEDLVKTASTMMILMFALTNLSVIIMRFSGIQSYRPTFKAPLTPWIQIVTIVIYIFLIIEMGYTPIAITAGFSLLAIIWYLVYVQRKIDRESAIVYLVKRIASKHIKRTGLEDELKQIAIERDDITPDRFDRLINNCTILDLDQEMNAKSFFKLLAEKLESKISIKQEELYKLFISRERESTTVIKPGLAIPHIIIDGKDIFEVALIRSKAGIIFSELQKPVNTAFVLIGSPDQRNYHLRALMFVAHIVSEDDFEKRWFDAKNPEQLRDIVLLSKRKRENKNQ
jgi:amino acid transporter/mannitol/fructose-specific phosphotransferase system IIA component (Ntr-type)